MTNQTASDTTISHCSQCGQEMRPTDYIARLQEQLAKFTAAMPEEPKRYAIKVWSSGNSIDQDQAGNWVASADYDTLAERCAALKVERDTFIDYGIVTRNSLDKVLNENATLKAKLEAAERHCRIYQDYMTQASLNAANAEIDALKEGKS